MRRVKREGSGIPHGAFLPPGFGLILCMHSLRTREAKKYHPQLPVSSKGLLILKFAHNSLRSHCWNCLSPVTPISYRRYCNTLLTSPYFWSHPPHHSCSSNSCWRMRAHTHTQAPTPIPPNPFSITRVLFLEYKPVHCTTFFKTLQRFPIGSGSV